MEKISEAALKKTILAVESERLKNPLAFRPDCARRPGLQRGRRKSEETISALLRESGLDLKDFQARQQQRSAERERKLAQQKAEVVGRSAKERQAAELAIKSQIDAWRGLGVVAGPFVRSVVTLDTPFLIAAIPSAPISTSEAVPFHSCAKFTFETPQTPQDPLGNYSPFFQKFGFYFQWVNHLPAPALIDVTAYMSAAGDLSVSAPGALSGTSSSISAFAVLNLWFGWPTDVTSMPFSILHLVDELEATPGDVEYTPIQFPLFSLGATMFAVPPGAVTVFEVSLLLESINVGGTGMADFESRAFQIVCPSVVVSINGPDVVRHP